MQHQRMGMSKKKFRIGDLAQELKVKKYVVRFWEKEFDLDSDRSEGGQRFYTSEDLALFMAIKDLLYNRGFTISGARKELDAELAKIKQAQKVAEKVADSEKIDQEKIEVVVHDEVIGATKEYLLVNNAQKQVFLKELSGLKEELLRLQSLLK